MLLVDETGAPFEVDDLDAEGVLASARMSDRQVRRAELVKLELAAHWCVLHPPTEETGYSAWNDDLVAEVAGPETLGGDGTPGVAAFTPEPFGAALGITTHSAMSLLADVLDLQHRLPALWAGVQDLAVAAWKARRVATQTRDLPLPAARWIDAKLAGRLDRIGPITIDRLVEQAKAEFDLEQQRQREETERERWRVRLTHGNALNGFAGTSTLEITGDAVGLQRFHDLVCDHAETLGRLGDQEPWEVRKAKAIGIIASEPTALDQLLDTIAGDPGTTPAKPTTSVTSRRHSVLYLHFTPQHWAAACGEATPDGLGTAEGLGPATLATILAWLAGTHVKIQPVLDLARTDGVDAHDPPAWLADLVRLRDRHCVFPHCHRDSRRCDLDHIVAYHDTGPPGQTVPENLAPLCRRHHRAKTHGRWRYQRLTDGSYHWRSPHGHTYAVLPEGTLAI